MYNSHTWRIVRYYGTLRVESRMSSDFMKASVLVPTDFPVQSVQLQLVSDVIDIFLNINVTPIPRGKKVLVSELLLYVARSIVQP